MAQDNVNDPGPLDWRISIVDKQGRPSPEFQRRWNTNRNNTALIGTITFGSGPPPSLPAPSDGAEYADTSTTPYTIYIGQGGNWNSATPVSANPTALAGDVVVDGTAHTFLRSDGAPAVQKATTSQFGLVKPDGSTIDVSGGVISVPDATTSAVGLVKPDGTTIGISTGVISVPTATTSSLGLVQPDGTTITISGGVISSSGGGGGGTLPTIRGHNIQASSAGSYVATLPTGTIVGDVALLFVGGGYGVSSTPLYPAGWTQLDNQQGSNWNGAVFGKVMTSFDIFVGNVTVTNAGSFDSVVGLITFVGGTSGVIGFVGLRDGSGSGSESVSTPSYASGGLQVMFASGRSSGIPTISPGTLLDSATDGGAAAGSFYTQPLAGQTFPGNALITYPVGGPASYQCIVIVIGP